jgi:hypothetical protein
VRIGPAGSRKLGKERIRRVVGACGRRDRDERGGGDAEELS